jgi:hypothetical protein
MDGIAEFVNTNLLPHWPFVSGMMIFMIIGRVMSKNIFFKDAHKTNKPVWLFWWGRKTLALHPIVAGLMLGMIWRDPEAGVKGLAASMGYFAMAGAFSVWAYETLKGIAKKEGIDLDLPGVDDSVPPTPPAA